MYLKILDPARLLYKDYSFYILLFLFLHNISNYINKETPLFKQETLQVS